MGTLRQHVDVPEERHGANHGTGDAEDGHAPRRPLALRPKGTLLQLDVAKSR